MTINRPNRPNSKPAPTKEQNTGMVTDADFENKTFNIRLIKTSALKSALDLTYNEVALKQLLIQVESEMEKYHIMRLSLMREAAARDKAGMPQEIETVEDQQAANIKLNNTKITNDLL